MKSFVPQLLHPQVQTPTNPLGTRPIIWKLLYNSNVCLAISVLERKQFTERALQFIKMKTSKQPFPISKLCHVTDNWHYTYLWYTGSPPVGTQKNWGNKRDSRVSEFEMLQLHCIGWSGGSTVDVNLLTSSVGLNYSSPGHSQQQFLLCCVSTVKSSQQHNKTPVPVIYCAVMAVLKEEAAWPSKCLSFLPPWHTATVRSLCSEDLTKKT